MEDEYPETPLFWNLFSHARSFFFKKKETLFFLGFLTASERIVSVAVISYRELEKGCCKSTPGLFLCPVVLALAFSQQSVLSMFHVHVI